MDSIWFYTLSTSAQVLAALAGLFAVFVVWKIQTFEPLLKDLRRGIILMISYVSNNTRNYEKISIETLDNMPDDDILKKFNELLNISTSQPQRVGASTTFDIGDKIPRGLDKRTADYYEKYIRSKSVIIRRLKKILISNLLVIAACLVLLTITNIIRYKFFFLFLITILVIYCLYLIGSGIYEIATNNSVCQPTR